MTYVQVLECGIIKSTVISEVFVPIPEPSVTIANERTENYEFTSIITVPASFNAVGSGEYSTVSLLLGSVQYLAFSVVLSCCVGGTSGCLTTGTVTCKTYWVNASNTKYISDGIDGGALPLRR